jgi:hypothetical protein
MIQLHLIITAIATVVFCSVGITWGIRSYWESFGAAIFSILGGMALFILLISLVPYSPKYWMVYPESGTITTLAARSAASESKLTSEFALKLDESDTVIISTDPRLLTLQEGDEVALACTWGWRPQGKDQYNCVLAN